MRGVLKAAVGLMAVLSLAGCGGSPEGTPEPEAQLGEVEQGLACRYPDDYCPGSTVCVDGMCRDCINQPHWCN
ncbi:hypothetical protein HPC49_53095 [Pyxidicoccus fallax]|uniref:Lipoprotein n=1 Tax=Pyxidicoccus fallax TaxID=394095 RepID=A0A848M127_9BACT|nr:hypothetical protein [Pyxidicoccus fallax]NMO23561.1 hypothetical protein [Pyxidicoccus fallax]NPC86909.1 hypothetical protein [Pyxidicoccus fallax]